MHPCRRFKVRLHSYASKIEIRRKQSGDIGIVCCRRVNAPENLAYFERESGISSSIPKFELPQWMRLSGKILHCKQILVDIVTDDPRYCAGKNRGHHLHPRDFITISFNRSKPVFLDAQLWQRALHTYTATAQVDAPDLRRYPSGKGFVPWYLVRANEPYLPK